MYGWRARLGLILPSTNTTADMEFLAMAPEGVTTHSTRLYYADQRTAGDKEEGVTRMAARLEEGIAECATFRPATIVYACTTASFIAGAQADRTHCEATTRATGIPFVTTSTAILWALAALGARRVALVTPYEDAIVAREVAYLQQAGFDVAGTTNLHIAGALEKGHQPPWTAFHLARGVDTTSCDAVVISCTNWRTVEMIRSLELSLSVPVISSNQASFWAALGLAGVPDPIEGFGSLLNQITRPNLSALAAP